MTREETVKIIRIMVDSYPNYKPNNISETVDVWNMMLSDYDYNLVAMALKAYILSDTSGFAPSIGQLVAKIQALTKPQELSEMEAWSLVSKAIRNSGYNSVEEFANLPPLVQKAVGTPDNLRNWAVSDYRTIESVIQSNFLRTYGTVVKRENEINCMPNEIKALIDKTNINSKSAQIEQNNQRSINSLLHDKKLQIGEISKREEYIEAPKEFEDLINKLK